MRQFIDGIKRKTLAPILAMRREYVPLLAVYFAAGFMGLDAVTRTFFYKNELTLSAETLVGLSIWIMLPWSIKMVFGSVIDGVAIFGNNRKSYIFIGSTLSILGSLLMVDLASKGLMARTAGPYATLLISGLLTSCGAVIADIVADTLAIEVVPRDDQYEHNLGMVQVLSRLMLAAGSVTSAMFTGTLAALFIPAAVFAMTAFIPVISIIGAALVKCETEPDIKELDVRILVGGILFGAFCVVDGLLLEENAQLVLFCVSLVVISTMLTISIRDMDHAAKKTFLFAAVAIFLFRVIPGIGPGMSWWYIGALKFDERFMGLLSLVTSLSAFLVLWFMADIITRNSIRAVMITLTVVATILSLPDILIFYGYHEALGLTPRQVLLVSSTLVAPLGGISMIPLGVLIAKNAPPSRRAIYISLTASFMNIALVGSDVITKYLNKAFVVTRSDFSKLGPLMITALAISTVLSIIGIIFLRYEKRGLSRRTPPSPGNPAP